MALWLQLKTSFTRHTDLQQNLFLKYALYLVTKTVQKYAAFVKNCAKYMPHIDAYAAHMLYTHVYGRSK